MIEEVICPKCGVLDELVQCVYCLTILCDSCMEEHNKEHDEDDYEDDYEEEAKNA